MAPINLAYLMRATSRGRAFWYYRRDGQLTRIPGQPGEVAFLAEY